MIEINDIRELTDFKGKTFSSFKKHQVITQLLNNLEKNKVEDSCYWSCELICAGHFLDVWNAFVFFYSTFIHLGNPKLIVYISRRLNNFKTIIRNAFIENELALRNHEEVRKMFAEIVCLLCYSRKKPSFRFIQIADEEMNITNITDKFTAPNIAFASEFIHEDDEKEIFVAVNELVYNLEKQNVMNSCYWIEWLLAFETTCLRKKVKFSCAKRYTNEVERKNQTEVVWLIWEILLTKIHDKISKCLQEVSSSAFNLFSVKYKRSFLKQRRSILYFIVQLICETNVDLTREIIEEKHIELTKGVLQKIDTIYGEIKKKEIAPITKKTDFLLQNASDSKKINLEKSMGKIKILDDFY
jgi:hypothetical protein|tara:strand:+ start:243 stop:1310 length:1068 start_codon:yes stop_codon:yes gene_type:complete